MSFKSPQQRKRWTKEELSLLDVQWPLLGEKCINLFPDRTVNAIRQMAKRNKTKFTERKEIIFVNIEKIKELLVQGKRLPEISSILKINYHTMKLNLKKLNFKTSEYYRKYTSPKQSSRIRKFLISEISSCCQICSFNRALDIAHIVPAKDGGPLEVWNCLSLCPNHHRLFDRNELTELELFKIENKIKSAFEYFPIWIKEREPIYGI